MAGLFYAWSISVTPGLARIDNTSYLQAFQAMNRAILTPLFFLAFFGMVLLLPLLSYNLFRNDPGNQFLFVIIATFFYFIGVMGVTIFGNVPLNNTLESLQVEKMTAEQMAIFRQGFESKWNRLNYIRTITSLFSFFALVLACVQTFNE